ncbi:hypothetical protein [Pelagibius sp.]|uniref:hypothetical protein n=1 Tax=Pelagibius sp. TaxID=1931238 RepID=UPI003BAEFD54
MQNQTADSDTTRFARCIEVSKRVRWDIDEDVIRGRKLDMEQTFLPEGLSQVGGLSFLSDEEKRFLSQIQGRTYANIFGLVERFINAKVLEISRDHALGDQTALEALVRFSDEELKHQELFRRIDAMAGDQMPGGYKYTGDPDAVAQAVLGMSTWAVLVLTLHIELFTQLHYRESLEPDETLSPLFKDVFLFHWKEESQHAIMDELELRRIDAGMTAEQREEAVDEFISLVGAVDGLLQAQASEDARYFIENCGRRLSEDEQQRLEQGILGAYRWQYVVSGAQHRPFQRILGDLITEKQAQRINTALAPLVAG